MRIDIILDVICPWCFIGKRRLEKALDLRPEVETEIGWRPFQLNPEMPLEGMTRQDYLAAKFGGNQHAGRINNAVADAGASVGITFSFDRIRRTPNTRDAHRLIRHAEQQGQGDAVVEALFEGYFIQGRDIGNRDTLAAIAGENGLDETDARRFLGSETALAEILSQDRDARRIGINAVPCFIFDSRYAVSGAQEPEFFLPVFDLVQNGGEVEAG